MELLKLYRGKDNHQLALHRSDDGQYLMTVSFKDCYQRPHRFRKVKAWIILDHFENLIYQHPEYEFKPVPLLVSRFEGHRHFFETPDELEAYYSDLGVDAARVADLLRRGIPVIFGELTAYRERPWHYNDGLVARRYGKRSAL